MFTRVTAKKITKKIYGGEKMGLFGGWAGCDPKRKTLLYWGSGVEYWQPLVNTVLFNLFYFYTLIELNSLTLNVYGAFIVIK